MYAVYCIHSPYFTFITLHLTPVFLDKLFFFFLFFFVL